MKANALLTSLLLSAGLALSSQAQALQLSFDPAAAGLAGAAFLADSLTGSEVSVVSNGGPDASGGNAWREVGYMQITGAALNGVPAVTSGLGSSYALYLAFDIYGYQQDAVHPGYSTAANINLYGVNGPSIFAINAGGAARLTSSNAAVLLATTSNAVMKTYANLVSPPPQLALDLFADVRALVQPVVPGFITGNFSVLGVHGSFVHPSAGVQILNGGATFVINGGADTLIFAAVPEPASCAMLGLGLL